LDPLPKSTLAGSLHLEWKRCGKPACRCTRGQLHGPYIYRRWREGARQRKAYVPADDVLSTLLAIAARRHRSDEVKELEQALKRARKEANP
jgi:hypothetical protein